MAKKKDFYGLVDDDYRAYEQYLLENTDGAALMKSAEQAEANLNNSASIMDNRRGIHTYEGLIHNLNVLRQLGGTVPGLNDGYMQSLQDQYNQSWDVLNKQIQDNQMAYQIPGLAQQAEQLSRERGMEITPARLMGQMGLVDANGNLTDAGQKYWQRGAYQQGITDAQEKQAQWGEQAQKFNNEMEEASYWLNQVQTAPEDSDVLPVAANAMGIVQWTDREDLLQQLQAKADRAQRMGATPMRLAQQGAAQEKGYQGALYQLDHPDVSLDGAYYLSEAEKYEAQKRERWLHGDLWNGTVAWARENRARDSYAQINYDETKRETLGQIMADPALGQAYQSAQKMTWDLRTVEYLDEYIQGAMNTNGVLTADDIGQIRLVALQNGIDLPEDDAQIRQEVNRMMREYSGQLETDLAELEAAGYDRAQLLDYMERDIDAAAMREYNAQNRAAAEEHGVGMSLASSAANLVSGTGYISAIPQSMENLWATLTGNYDAYAPINTDSRWFRAGSFVKEVRDEVSQNLAEQYPDGTFMGQNTASFLYGTGMSMLDNIVQMAVGAAMFSGAGSLGGAIAAGSPVTLGTMGLSAATNDLIQLTKEGTPAGQAMLLSTLRGGLEILTEKIGIDMLVSNMGRQQMGNLAKQIAASMLRQGAAEGAEEAIAEVGGDLADVLVRADESEMRQAIAQGMASGMTEKEAFIQYIMDLGKRTVAATAGGFLSGLGFGGGAVATNLAADSNTARGKTVLHNRTLPQLQQQAGFYGVDASGITEASTDRDIGRVHRQVERAARGAEEELLQFARGKKYTQDGIQALQHAYAEYSSTGAGKMSPQEFAISFDTAYQHGQSDAQYNAEGSYLERAAKDGLTAGLTPGTIAYAYHSGAAAIKRTLTAKTQTTKQGDAEKKNAARAAQTAKTANVMQVERISDHDAILVMPDGTRQNITAMDTRGTAAQIVSEAMDDGYSTVVVNQMLKNFDGKMDPGVYYEQFRSAMLAGIEGESLSQAKKAADQLPAAVAKEAHDRGRLLGKAYDLADRIGSAGEQALERYGYAAPAEFEKFYKAGLEGKSFRQAVKELGEVSEEIKNEMQAAVQAGLRDKQGGFEYGEQSDGNRKERQADVDPGQRSGRMAEGAVHESGRTGQTQGRSSAEAEGQNTRPEQVSAKALGLAEGTDRATATIIREDRMTEAQKAKVQEYRDAGMELVLIEGYMEIMGDGGRATVRGAQAGDRIIATVSDPAATWDQIARHEAKHRYFEQHPDALQQEWNRVAGYMSQEDIDLWLAAYAEQYAALSDEITVEYLMEEALCDLAADIDYLDPTEAGYQALERAQVMPQTGTKDTVFAETSTAQSDTMDNAPRYMVAGRWAEYADSGQLARAEELENKGASAQKILKETGWYRGADGQWRFEIDDSVMRYKRPLPSLLKRTNGQVLLKDILYHPDLFANYPFLNKVKVIFMQMPEGQRGSYNPYTATVKLNVSLLSGPEATLLHELQHAIQEFEGFAGGAYQGYWRKKKLTGYIETMKVRELENKIMEFSMDPKTRDAAAMWHRMQEVKEDPNALKELKKEAARDGLTMKIAKFQSLQDQRAKAAAEFIDRDSYDLYRNTAGEVEARTTAERQYMTEPERRNNLHFVGDKNTVFADVFGEPMDSEQMDMEAEPTAEQQLKTAQQRIKALEGINQHLREQWKLTPQYTPDARQISKAAGMFMKEYAGSWSQKELEGKLAALWKTAQQRTKGEVSFDAMMEQTRKLAAELVQNYLDSGVQDAETIREIKQYVRSTRMYLSPDLRSDLDHYGGYQAVRKANFGRIRLANSGMGVDQVYQELHEQYPAYFPEGIWNPADQLMQIIDVVNDGTQVLQRSPMAMMSDGMDYMTNKILWELGLVNPAPKTKADELLEAAAKVSNRDQVLQAAGAHEQERMDQLEAYYKQQLQKVKNSREDAIQKLKERYRQKAQEQRDWKAEQEVKNKLLYHAAKLKRMSRKTSPEQQRQIQDIFGDINTLCKHMTGFTVVRDYVQGMSTDEIRPEGYRDLSDPGRIMDTEEGAMLPEYRGDKMVDLDNLKKWYDGQKKNNPDFIPDKRIEEILASWEAKQINMMSVQEAQALLDVALNIENEIRTQKQLIDAKDRREVYQQVRDVIDDVNSTKGKYDNLLSRGFTGWITESTLSPVRMIQRLTGYQDSDPMYQATVAMQQGEMKMLDYQRRAYEMFKPFTDDKAFMDYLAGKGRKQEPITIGGMDEQGNIVEVKITPDMRVALYLHSQNYQNLRHIQRGGLTVPHYESYVKGKMEEAYDRATRLRLTPSQVRQITSHMTQREIAYAQRLEKYFNVMSKTEINETAVKLKGYEIAKTNHYYPIETNKEFVVKEFDSLKFDGSLENMGFTKERIEGGNPIMLGNASTTLARSVKQHSMYTGLAIPLRNFNKLRGVSIVKSDEAGAVKYQSDSLMDTIRKKWGKSGLDYIEKMVADLSGVKPQQDRGMQLLNKLRSNYAGAVLELNPSTAMKQLIAYPSAASILGWDAMSVGLSKWQKVDVEEVNKYTPLLWHRMQGYIDSDLGDYVSQKKHKPRGLNWNQGVDVAVVKRIWKAAEWKVAHENRALVRDRDAWMKATAELFNQVMLQSQANYTTMQRGQILRTDNVFLRSLAMFKTEPFQSFNVLYDAFANEAAKRRQLEAARQEAERGDDDAAAERVKALEQDHKAAKQRIGNALPAVLASNLMEALITFAWAFFRGKDEDWEDEEKGEITAGSFFKRLGMRTLGNLAGIMPFGGELAEAVTAAIMGDQYYGIENTETSVIADAMSNFVSLTNTVKGWLAKPEEGEDKQLQVYDIVLEALDQGLKLGALLGVPTENVAKMLKGVTRWTLIAAMGETEGEYWYRRFTSQTTGSGHAKEDLDSLYLTLEEGDMEAYGRLMDSILRYKDAESIESGLVSRTKAATVAGNITQEQALQILQTILPATDPDDLYWKVQGWGYMESSGEDSFSKYDYVYDAMYDGTGFDAAYQQLLDHGITEEQAGTQIRGQIRDWYQNKSDDGLTITEAEALQMLQQYGGKSAEDAAAQIQQWNCLIETGIAYADIKENVIAGNLSEAEAANMLQKYGGKSAEDANSAAASYVFLRENPDLEDKYGADFVQSMAEKYAVYGSGINVNVYAEFVQFAQNTSADQDENGNWVSGTRKPKIVAYVAAIPGLTPEQRDNLMLTDYSTYNLDDMPW